MMQFVLFYFIRRMVGLDPTACDGDCVMKVDYNFKGVISISDSPRMVFSKDSWRSTAAENTHQYHCLICSGSEVKTIDFHVPGTVKIGFDDQLLVSWNDQVLLTN
jgi:hypothetical protein